MGKERWIPRGLLHDRIDNDGVWMNKSSFFTGVDVNKCHIVCRIEVHGKMWCLCATATTAEIEASNCCNKHNPKQEKKIGDINSVNFTKRKDIEYFWVLQD